MKQYNTVYADPPWSYEKTRTGRNQQGGAQSKYQTMSVEEIMNLPLVKVLTENALLFLWITVPLLPTGLAVMEAWGFRYVTALTWRKLGRLGMGYWFRVDCEHLLVGVKGEIRALGMQVSNFYECRSGRHSQKPDYYRQLVARAGDKAFGGAIKLELFARSTRDLFPGYGMEGWDVFGNEVDGSIDIK